MCAACYRTVCDMINSILCPTIPEFSKPFTIATVTLHCVFYCVARTWVVIGCQRDLLLMGRLLWMNLRPTRCKLRLSRDALVKGLQNLIIVSWSCSTYNLYAQWVSTKFQASHNITITWCTSFSTPWLSPLYLCLILIINY